jgi:RimJ/RimL family protein N-acetyltransferase
LLQYQEIELRQLTEADKPVMARLANNKKVWDNLRDLMPHPYNEEDAHFFIELTRHQLPPLDFAILWRNELCGVIGLGPQHDVYRKTAEIGYWIGEPYWSKGIATKAVRLLTAYGFEQLRLARIHAGIFEYNPASMRVLEKNGYVKEGVFRKSIFKNDKLWDEHRYAIINETLS